MSDQWRRTTLGDATVITIGKTPPRKEDRYWTDDLSHPFCTIADMTDSEVNPVREGVTTEAIAEGKAKLVPAGSLLMSFKLTIGRVGFAARNLYPNEAIAWIRSTDPDLDERFLALWLSSQDLTAGSGRAVKGATLNGESLRAIDVIVPPLAVQRRIVDLIAYLDTHLANLRAESEALLKGLDCARIELTAAWGQVPLAEVCSIESCLVDPTKPPYSQMLHIGIERMGKDGGNLMELETAAAERLKSSKFLISENDVVFSKIRPNLRKVTVPGFEALCSADAYPLRPIGGLDPRLLREVLLHPLVTEAVVAKSGRTKMPKVNRRELFEVPVPMTDDLDARHRVGQVLEAMRTSLDGLTGEIDALLRLRGALLPRLLGGDVSIDFDYDSLLPEVA